MADLAEAVPLARLFAMSFTHCIDALHTKLEERGWHDVRPSYGYVLLAARESGTTAQALTQLMGVSKQAISKLITQMLEGGYLEYGSDDGDGRIKHLQITDKGLLLLTVAEEIYLEIEQDWADIIGRKQLDMLRSQLSKVMRAFNGGKLPAVRPSR